ncbi:MAG: MtaA/CmuA family methyltransferase [Methanomassiliicoccales archaeon]|nr:MtaA/CmuA family methyltransferase [Methanomassiliicoccales archaeon]
METGGERVNEKDRLLAVLNLEEVDRPPCVSPMQTGTIDLMRACGAYWPEAHVDSHLMTKLAAAAHKLVGIESVRVPFDISVDASAFGAITGTRGLIRQPGILKRLITTPEELKRVKVPNPLKDGRAPITLRAIRELSSKYKTVPVICGTIAPFMLASQLRGEQDAIVDISLNPEFMKGILEKAAEWNIAYADRAIKAGADVITLVDSSSSDEVLSQSQYEEFSMPYQKMVVDAIRKMDRPIILHMCGKTTRNFHHIVETRPNGFSIDQQMDIKWVKERLSGRVATIGNVSPTTTLLYGTPEEVSMETRASIEAGTDVVAPGCGFAIETPFENMKAMVETARTHGERWTELMRR